MTFCKGLFLGVTFLAMGLVPLASDSDAQQYCPRNINVLTLQKQSQTTQMYQQAQARNLSLATQKQQQQAQLMDTYHRLQTPIAKTTTQTAYTATPTKQTMSSYVQKTAQALQHQQHAINKTEVLVQHTPGHICNKTTPQILTTQSLLNTTASQLKTTTTPVQCTSTQMKHPQQQIPKTTTSIAHTGVPLQHTISAIKRTENVVNKTSVDVKYTPTTINRTATATQLHLNVNCMQCHHAPPASVQTAKQLPQALPKSLPVQQMVQLPAKPLVVPVAQPLRLPPTMVAMHKPLPQVTAVLPSLELPLAKWVPNVKAPELGTLVRMPEKKKLDPLAPTAVAKKPVGDKLQILVAEGGPETILRMGGQDLLAYMLPEVGRRMSGGEAYSLPLSDEDLQLPPVRLLAAGVLHLPALLVVPEVFAAEEELLPPSAESKLRHDPQDFFAPAGQPVPVQAAPRPTPVLIQPYGPPNRDTTLAPG